MTPPQAAVRVGGMADVPALVGLIQSAYRGVPGRAGWTSEAGLLEGPRTDSGLLGAELADSAAALLVAEDATGRLGCCVVTDRGGGTAYFGTFAVRPAAQGRGIGSLLLAAAEDRARAAGAARMEMTVLAQRRDLIAWYARRGYAPTGQTRPFPYGNDRVGRPLRDDLVFTVLAAPLRRPRRVLLPVPWRVLLPGPRRQRPGRARLLIAGRGAARDRWQAGRPGGAPRSGCGGRPCRYPRCRRRCRGRRRSGSPAGPR